MELQISITVVILLIARAYARPSCSVGQYYDLSKEQCNFCTLKCPANTVVLLPCQKNSDTKCGLIEDIQWPGFKFDHIGHVQVEETTTSTPTPETDNESDSHHWFTISMLLLGILGFLGAVIVVYVFASYILWRKKGKKERIVFNPVYLERPPPEEPRYVEVFPSSRDRLKGHRPLSIPTFQSTSVLPLLQPEGHDHIYVNFDHCHPELHSSNTAKDTNDYVYLETN